MSAEALDAAVRRTADAVPGQAAGTRYSGDHLNALCRALARIRLRDNRTDSTVPADVDRALTEWIDRAKLTPAEERVVASHEAGHAVCSLHCPHSPPIERISILDDMVGALGFVRYQDREHRYVVTRGELLDDVCVLMGGREAEQLLLDDISIGSVEDLRRATAITRALVEEFGMGGDGSAVCRFHLDDKPERIPDLSEEQRASLDRRVGEILEDARLRASKILLENRATLESLRNLLLEKKVVDAKALEALAMPSMRQPVVRT
jgi:cell division protease FtsH